MKFNFKIQQYQTDAVDAVVRVFNGQPHYDRVSYIRDLGRQKATQQTRFAVDEDDADLLSETGYKNEAIALTDGQLLDNIKAIQNENNIKASDKLIGDVGRCSLDIEMETGTGKTYVYIKTMFELNKRYGWSKFIVVVPSIAIREGVNKSFQITEDHFMEQYGKKARFFIYNSSNLNELDNFSSSSGINVMIINTQAFASSLKEDGKSKEARIIYLQSDIKKVLYDRPTAATSEYFKGKFVKVDGKPTAIDDKTSNAIEFYLIANQYVDMDRKVTDKYRMDMEMGTLAPMPPQLAPMAEGIHTLVQAVFDESALERMVENGKQAKVESNGLNQNFYKKEFQELWKRINHKYAYAVSFDSTELIEKAIRHIDSELFVSELTYTVSRGEQTDEMDANALDRGEAFKSAKTRTTTLKRSDVSHITYDLVGKIAEGTVLTRRTVVEIIKGISPLKFAMYKANPEEFISKVIRLINEQKATMIVEHITYDQIEGEYDSTIFTAEKNSTSIDKAFKATKHIQDYVFTDGYAEKSVERRFAEDLDAADEVCVYAKLPRGFHIPTPVGNYSPDWAIAFYEGTVKHIYFIAETKGTMESLSLKPIEKAKISCARKLFNEISTENVKYHDVDSYQKLLDVMNSL